MWIIVVIVGLITFFNIIANISSGKWEDSNKLSVGISVVCLIVSIVLAILFTKEGVTVQ